MEEKQVRTSHAVALGSVLKQMRMVEGREQRGDNLERPVHCYCNASVLVDVELM